LVRQLSLIDLQKTTVDQNVLENSLLSEYCWLYFGSDCVYARQCSVTPRKSDATVSTKNYERKDTVWWLGVEFSRPQSTGLLHL